MIIFKECIKKFVYCVLILFFTGLSANAANNSLTGIDVKQSTKDGYNIILNLEGIANVKKIMNTADTLALMLNSTVPSNEMEIIYDNTSGINNVTVQKKNQENTIIVLEGKNISNSVIYSKDISTGLITPINTGILFFGVNKNLMTLSIAAMLLWFSIIFGFRKNNRNKNKKSNKILRNISLSTAPSIAYKPSNSYISVPKDFIINRYMQEEKIQKAG